MERKNEGIRRMWYLLLMVPFVLFFGSIMFMLMAVDCMVTSRDWKMFKWRMFRGKRCPYCGSRVLETGYPDDDGRQWYRCDNDRCKFNVGGKDD